MALVLSAQPFVLDRPAEPCAAVDRTPTFDAVGTPVSLLDKPRFMRAIEGWLSARAPGRPGAFVCFRDVHGVVRSWREPQLAQAHAKALMVAPDGAPLAWLARRRGHRFVRKVCGPEMMLELCRRGESLGWRHAFYGATPEVLADLVDGLRRQAPDLKVVAAIAPPFGAVADDRMERMIEDLRDARPDLVWVGLGSPRQELWMADHAHQIPGAICFGVGAAFEIHAGHKQRSPILLQRLGLEWLGRILMEPRRLGLRYARVAPPFLWRVLCEELRGVRPAAPGPLAAE
jgi:N-acetylglucosaminyldiphosphoundecaprenol N-acetyl-beta-D-mannosaminyltransferase